MYGYEHCIVCIAMSSYCIKYTLNKQQMTLKQLSKYNRLPRQVLQKR